MARAKKLGGAKSKSVKRRGNGRASRIPITDRKDLLEHLQTMPREERTEFLRKKPHYEGMLLPEDYEVMSKWRSLAPKKGIRVSNEPTKERRALEARKDLLDQAYDNLGGSEAHERLRDLARKGAINLADKQLLNFMDAKAKVIAGLREEINNEIRKGSHSRGGHTYYVYDLASRDRKVGEALYRRGLRSRR